ncbi:Rv3654c family TadE-like protein [Dermatophilus congolensis]|uniref:Helicase/secretion neighborhood TadE-like protein n=1 Tax=Dermatophilus congolensis TaxID=1863 RepID=A0A239VAA0_9MICO|nr:Rv3654c family TadE-like protein [Dermatophilus congolensis]MBO3130657.1 flp pilus-assembly TadE/G-like family protein [Dermatophilus congolensis]MBO3130713.1 flp pilus-assembly TadE/G-like family protein [Dermatophilus congolensis]MBO3135130.1 flp pilus-assembly TadE/G-like family protein [Dermatophilus congolensis]MBO3137369.1 flp pilus-assembly TadE/G-like family protein [Dermatophilus congolensis]MBO3139610.1 flp pilus-assembly TadE/G-like family protein [Dermatophilus congolensis]
MLTQSSRKAAVDARDRGSGTVLVLGIVGLVITVFLAWVVVGAAVIASHRATAAADLAAVGAAKSLVLGGSGADACRRGRSIAQKNDARLSSCRVSGKEVAVTAVVNLSGSLPRFGFYQARAEARAGVR